MRSNGFVNGVPSSGPRATSTSKPGAKAAQGVAPKRSANRTSQLLRGILTRNPGVQTFTVERILESLGYDQLEASLMVFTIPSIIPVPKTGGGSGTSAVIGAHILAGQKQIRLPRFILRKTVSRRALAVAIHSILPVLEAGEKFVRPRWKWVSHSTTRRAVGLFVFLLAISVAFPLFGFNALHATSIFVMALGMAEQDGIAVLVGVAVGMLSLALLAVTGASARALKVKTLGWLRKIARKLGLGSLARYLRRRGYPALARLVTFHWSELLLLWDPEKARRRGGKGGAGGGSLPKPRSLPHAPIRTGSVRPPTPAVTPA